MCQGQHQAWRSEQSGHRTLIIALGTVTFCSSLDSAPWSRLSPQSTRFVDNCEGELFYGSSLTVVSGAQVLYIYALLDNRRRAPRRRHTRRLAYIGGRSCRGTRRTAPRSSSGAAAPGNQKHAPRTLRSHTSVCSQDDSCSTGCARLYRKNQKRERTSGSPEEQPAAPGEEEPPLPRPSFRDVHTRQQRSLAGQTFGRRRTGPTGLSGGVRRSNRYERSAQISALKVRGPLEGRGGRDGPGGVQHGLHQPRHSREMLGVMAVGRIVSRAVALDQGPSRS